MDTYEKKYKNALEWARQVMTGETGFIRKDVEEVFPELAESNDEKIRKEIVDFITSSNKYGTNERCEAWLAWLEKQGEPIEINPSEFDLHLNKLLKQFESLPKEELISNLSYYLNVIQNDGTYKIEKQGQKLAWSEEDEIDTLFNLVKMYHGDYIDMPEKNKLLNWLVALKGRVQPKQEWSEEEEFRINRIVACLENLNVADNDILLEDVDWLKSLKERIGG